MAVFVQDVLPILVILALLWPSIGLVRDRGLVTEFYDEFLGIPMRWRRYAGIGGIAFCTVFLVGAVLWDFGFFPITV
jgi:hypothetical protein